MIIGRGCTGMSEVKTDLAPVLPSTLPDAFPDNPLEALSWLGETVEEVAEGLRARGIKGRQRIANECPLANYLRVWFPNPSIFIEVSVSDYATGYYFISKTPEIPSEFIGAFDIGKFPDLIADDG